MKIVANTPDELILESRPILGGVFLTLGALVIAFVGMNVIGAGNTGAGLAILVIGLGVCLGIFWAFIRYEAIRFSRREAVVQFRSRSLSGRMAEDIPLSSVSGAVIETSMMTSTSNSGGRGRSRKTQTRTYRAALAMRDKGATNRPLTFYYTSNEKPSQRARDAINAWLAQGQS